MIKKSIYVLNMALIIILLLFIAVNIRTPNEFADKCVQTEEDAIAIGEIICKRVYPDVNYEYYEWKCLYNSKEKIWIVFCSHTDGRTGGLPEIHIRKDNAEVIFLSLMA